MGQDVFSRSWARSREIAATPGWMRRMTGSMGIALGAYVGYGHYQYGYSLPSSVLTACLFAAAGAMFLTYGLAYSQVFGAVLDEPRPERSPEELAVLTKRLGVATWIMSLAALALSAFSLAKAYLGA